MSKAKKKKLEAKAQDTPVETIEQPDSIKGALNLYQYEARARCGYNVSNWWSNYQGLKR
ncbi:hypothetical protein GOV14_05205 [Candidatus Pacearchaeota archaeon]|nr:hypothetical protein [Candidatus Pacearchaeota archaeon]